MRYITSCRDHTRSSYGVPDTDIIVRMRGHRSGEAIMNRVSHDARSEDERGAMVTVAEFTVTEVCPQCGQTITIDVSV